MNQKSSEQLVLDRGRSQKGQRLVSQTLLVLQGLSQIVRRQNALYMQIGSMRARELNLFKMARHTVEKKVFQRQLITEIVTIRAHLVRARYEDVPQLCL